MDSGRFYITGNMQHFHPARNESGAILIFTDRDSARAEYERRFPLSVSGVIPLTEAQWDKIQREDNFVIIEEERTQ